MFSKLMDKAKHAKKGIGSDIKLIKTIKSSMVMVMMKFRQEAVEMESTLEEKLDKMLHSKTDVIIHKLHQLKEAISLDMKRWKH